MPATPTRTTVDQRVRGGGPAGSGAALRARPAAAGGGGGGRDGVRGAARGGVVSLAGAAVAGVAGIGVTWLVARGLGTEQAGAFFAATAVFVLVGGVAKLGTQTGLVYWPARLRATGQHHLLGACLRTGLVPVAVGSVLLAGVLYAAAGALARATAPGAGAQTVAEHTAQLRLLALFLPVAALTDALLTATRGYRQMRPTVLLDRLLRPALQLAGLGLLTLAALWSVPAPWAFAAAWVAPYLPVVCLAGFALRRTYRAGRSAGPAGPVADTAGPTPDREADPAAASGTPAVELLDRRQLGRRFWRFTGPRAVASVAQLALQRVDVLLVAALGGLAPAAVYAVAGRFVVLGQFANQGVSQAVQPRLAEALATGDTEAANRLYQTATGWLVLATWPLYLLVIGYAPVYLGLFGAGYRSGAGAAVVLACAMLVATGCGMVDMVLAMAGKTSWNLVNVLIALAVTVLLGLALIPRYGALGAAIGLAAAVLVNNLLPLAQVGRALQLHPFGAGTVAAGGLALACFGVLPQLAAPVLGTGPGGLLGTLALAVPAYLFGARRLRRPLALDSFTRMRTSKEDR